MGVDIPRGGCCVRLYGSGIVVEFLGIIICDVGCVIVLDDVVLWAGHLVKLGSGGGSV